MIFCVCKEISSFIIQPNLAKQKRRNNVILPKFYFHLDNPLMETYNRASPAPAIYTLNPENCCKIVKSNAAQINRIPVGMDDAANVLTNISDNSNLFALRSIIISIKKNKIANITEAAEIISGRVNSFKIKINF